MTEWNSPSDLGEIKRSLERRARTEGMVGCSYACKELKAGLAAISNYATEQVLEPMLPAIYASSHYVTEQVLGQIPRMLPDIHATAASAGQLLTRRFLGIKDPMADYDWPKAPTHADSLKLYEYLRRYYFDHGNDPELDIRKLATTVARNVNPIIGQNIVLVGGYTLSFLAARTLGTPLPALPFEKLTFGRAETVREDEAQEQENSAQSGSDLHDWASPEEGASSGVSRFANEEQRLNVRRRTSSIASPSNTPTSTRRRTWSGTVTATKVATVGVAGTVGESSVRELLAQAKVLVGKDEGISAAQVMRLTHEKLKVLHQPLVTCQYQMTKDRIKTLDTDFEAECGWGEAVTLSGDRLSSMVRHRIDLVHSNPAMGHSLDYLKSLEVKSRIERIFGNPCTYTAETFGKFDRHVFKKMHIPGKSVIAFHIHGRQPGAGKGMTVSDIAKAVDRPIIHLKFHDILRDDFWDASPRGFMFKKLAECGRTDVILQVDEFHLPDDEQHPDSVNFKVNLDPDKRFMDGNVPIPVHFIVALTSQFSLDHIPAAYDRAPGIEMHAGPLQRAEQGRITLETMLNAIEDLAERERVKDFVERRLGRLNFIGDTIDCGRRIIKSLAENMVTFAHEDVQAGVELSEQKHDILMLKDAIDKAKPYPPADQILEDVRRAVEAGTSLLRQSEAARISSRAAGA